MLLVFAVINSAAVDATLLLTLKKEQLQMRYAVTSVQADCHDLQNSMHQQQLSESRQQYEAAAKAQNAWPARVNGGAERLAALAGEAGQVRDVGDGRRRCPADPARRCSGQARAARP